MSSGDRIRVRGGYPLYGRVRVGGAKNATLKLMAAALMVPGRTVLRNVPAIKDVHVMMGVLGGLGAKVFWRGDHELEIDAGGKLGVSAPEALVREMRASIQVLGPLLARTGRAEVAMPGGCAIGTRPIDLHLRGLRQLGAYIDERHGKIRAEASELRGCHIHLDFPSVGATENLMTAAVLARGTTVIHNAAREPEIVELARFLNMIGGHVEGAGTDVIRVVGVSGPDRLRGADYTVVSDRIEAGTLLAAVAAAGGDAVVENVVPQHLEAVIAKLTEAGVEIVAEGMSALRVRRDPSLRLRPVIVRTQSYPGFPTDMQAQMMAVAALADGVSVITEHIYTSRFKHVDELRRMGADIFVDGHTAVVRGVPELTGTVVESPDLRAGAALVIAALAARGESWVEGVHHIDRGYEDFCGKLQQLGAEVERTGDASSPWREPARRAHA